MSYIFTIALAVAAIILLYASIGFYVDRSEAEACTQTQERLEQATPTLLGGQLKYVLSEFGMPEVQTPAPADYTASIASLRARGTEDPAKLIDLTTFETSHFLMSGYLKTSECNLFTNLARVNLGRSSLFLGELLKGTDVSLLEGELSDVDSSYLVIIHSAVPDKCGYEPENLFLTILEEKYCAGLHEQAFLLAQYLKASLDDVQDAPSKTYRAVMLNCMADCVNRDACLDNCLNEKIA
ncbi:MAG: hypothetical protein ABH829_04360 [archaeon]